LGWGSTFIKGNDEFLDLQSEIATKLASELIGGLDASETQQLAQKATESAEAMAEYEAGRREWNRRNKEGFDNAIKHFEKAIELDPNYAEPYVGLADTYGLLPIYNFAEPAVAMPKAKPYAQEAIKRNPNLAIAYTSIAMVNHVYDYNWLEAEANHRKALELNPNYATGHQWYGEYLYQTGQTALAFEHMSKAAELDPGSKIIKCQLAFCALLLNKIDFAEKAIKEALAIDPMFFFALEIQHLWLKQGNLEKTIDLVEEAREKYPNQANYLRLLFDLNWMANNRERALRCFIELQDKHNDSVQSHVIAQLYATLDEPENVYRWMQKSIDKRESMVPITMTYPPFEKYHKDPNFLKLFRQINHPLSKNKP
jgi:tetratricopeptide (TPR) repeat protein